VSIARRFPQMTIQNTGTRHALSRESRGKEETVSRLAVKRSGDYTFATHPGLPMRPEALQRTQPQDTSVPEAIDPSWATS